MAAAPKHVYVQSTTQSQTSASDEASTPFPTNSSRKTASTIECKAQHWLENNDPHLLVRKGSVADFIKKRRLCPSPKPADPDLLVFSNTPKDVIRDVIECMQGLKVSRQLDNLKADENSNTNDCLCKFFAFFSKTQKALEAAQLIYNDLFPGPFILKICDLLIESCYLKEAFEIAGLPLSSGDDYRFKYEAFSHICDSALIKNELEIAENAARKALETAQFLSGLDKSTALLELNLQFKQLNITLVEDLVYLASQAAGSSKHPATEEDAKACIHQILTSEGCNSWVASRLPFLLQIYQT